MQVHPSGIVWLSFVAPVKSLCSVRKAAGSLIYIYIFFLPEREFLQIYLEKNLESWSLVVEVVFQPNSTFAARL